MNERDRPAVLPLHAMLADACLSKDAERRFDADLRGYLGAHALASEDVAAIVASPPRLGLYRHLVRQNLVHVVRTMLERTERRIEARLPGAFTASIEGFLDDTGPKTPHLRDVPREFLSWAAPRWVADPRFPRWIVDHAELELVDFTVAVAPRSLPPPSLADVSSELPLVFAGPCTLVNLSWSVHTLAPEDDAVEPVPQAVTLLVYRDEAHRSRYLELSSLAAAMMDRWLKGEALGAAMAGACAASAHPLDAAVLSSTAALLADLGERGVLLGARSP